MSASYGKGARGKATKLHSKFVRDRMDSVCERCGRTYGDINPDTGKPVKQMHCAHIIGRQTAATRTDENNAFCLCASCHWFFGKWPVEFALFVFDKIGKRSYNKLVKKAKAKEKVDWDSEVVRLTTLLEGLEA